jgi:hypothetical protein
VDLETVSRPALGGKLGEYAPRIVRVGTLESSDVVEDG